MKGLLTILFLFTSFFVWANDDSLLPEVWVDGDTFYKSIPHKKQCTLYFTEWSDYVAQLTEEDTYFVAVQLDDRFDPIPTDHVEVPSITSLAAISSDSIFNLYLEFLESFGRTKGIDYMVLPDTAELAELEKGVVRKASERSPYYFLSKSALSWSVPDSKRDFVRETHSSPIIWVAKQDEDLSKLKKWRSKYLAESHYDYFDKLMAARKNEFTVIHEVPQRLLRSIFENGAIAIDPLYNLPLSAQTIAYLGDDYDLRNQLASYANVYFHRVEGIQTIVDIRNGTENLQRGDIVITKRVLERDDISQIVLPTDIENQHILLGKMMFGAMAIKGRHNKARNIENFHYAGHSEPSFEGMSDTFIKKLDSLGKLAVAHRATPGMQVAVIKNGSYIFNESYGYYTYDSIKPIGDQTIYDLASLTKVMATLPAISLLLDRSLVDLDDSIGRYLPEFRGSNKAHITLRQLLAHHGGLRSYIPFWSMVMGGDGLDPFYYRTPEDEAEDIRTYGLEPHPMMLDTLKGFIIQSDLIENEDSYNYSDIGFMILHMVVESVTGESFAEFVKREFYDPMGLINTTFNPILKGVPLENVAPTEFDLRFRNYQVWGEVHDRNAAVFGGVAGHAGLFSNATDVARMMTMFLNGGVYGGRRYLSQEVIDVFNVRYFDGNRRGLGWDKKGAKGHIASNKASDVSFGHSGFTGTMVWADPEQELIFVFLSNRIFPNENNQKLNRLKIRTLMHDSLYEALNNGGAETK